MPPKRKTPAKKTAAESKANTPPPSSLFLGDFIRVERRYVVDGVLTCVTDKGKFTGVQYLGSMEHLMLGDDSGVRMIPLPTISEIVVEESAPRPVDEGKSWDPSFQ